jgi:probable F420-dependent oxidoreductase
VRIDADLSFGDGDVATRAAALEAEGYDGLVAAEVGHDPLLILAQAAVATTRVELATGILVAFGRSPMVTATLANDVQILSRGRLILGLGSQIKPHIEKRYSMPWSHPAARMREYIVALRAIWACWNEGEPLRFRGEFYRHTLMSPFFSPAPHAFGPPKVFLAAVGEMMTEVAGEVADGLLVHPFTTERYLREVTLPALERGLARSGRTRADVQVSLSGLVATGDLDAARAAVRGQVAFYGSTPAYRPVLELHGWGELQEELGALTRAGRWEELAERVPDEVLEAIAVVAPPVAAGDEITRRFGDVVDRFSLYVPYHLAEADRAAVLTRLKEAP